MTEKTARQTEIEKSIIKRFRKEIWHPFVRALKLYEMISPGDKIAVCISGGKDSFLLAKCMQEIRLHGDMDFELVFLVMDPGYRQENRKLIEKNAACMGIPVTIEDSDIFESVTHVESSPCYLCARMRRGFLYARAKELGCNKIALGHHLDDAVETVLLSVLYAGQYNTMMPKLHSENFPGMELIRPLYLVRERDILAWRDFNRLKFLRCACRFTERVEEERLLGEEEKTSKRAEVKELIARLEKTNPGVVRNLLKSAENVNLDACLGYVQGGVRHSFLDTYAGGATASHGSRKTAGKTSSFSPDRSGMSGKTEKKTKAEKPAGGRKPTEPVQAYVYLLRCADGSFYCGYSTDVKKRLAAHNAGKGAKYTKSHGPCELVYTETCKTRGEALHREAEIKKYTHERKQRLISES